jgi:hypothetical protein
MVWLLRLLSAVAATITSLFVARDTLNFGTIELSLMITLIVGATAVVVA